MSLVFPVALALLALVLPVLWAFLTRRRAQRRVVSSILLLKMAADSVSTRRIALNLRHWLSLLLVLLALLLLVLALTDPRPGDARPGRLIVVLDTSSSMGASANDQTRLQEATDILASRLALAVPGDRVALITASSAAQVQLGLTTDLPRVLEVARSRTPAGSGAAVGKALGLADALCADPDVDEIILLSDGTGVVLPELRCPVRFTSVGVPRSNAGISTLTTRRADRLGLSEVLLSVDHSGRRARSLEVELRLDDRLVDVVPMELPAHGAAWALRSLELSGDVLSAQISDSQDGLGVDDVAVSVQAPPPPTTVLLVTDQPRGFVARALGLHPGVSLEVIRPGGTYGMGAVDLLVLEQNIDPLPPSRRILALGEGSAAVGRLTEVLEGPLAISRWDFDNTLFRYVDLQDINVQRAWSIDGGQPMVEAGEHVLAIRAEVAGRPAVAFAFRAEDSDLVLRVGFVNLLANAVEWAAPDEDAAGPAELGRVWPGASAGTMLVASAQPFPAWQPIHSAGVHAVTDSKGNLVGNMAPRTASASEIDLTPARDLGDQVEPILGGVGGSPWWLVLLGLGLSLLGAEWLLGAVFGWWRR